MKSNTKLNFLLLGLVIILFSILIFNQINITDQLYNYDSWHHLYFTEYGESEQFFSDSIQTYDRELTSSYKSFLRSESYLFHLITGISLFKIFQFSSIFLRILFILMVYITALTFTKNKKGALLTTILIFTSYYFVWRSYLTFPENLAVIFLLFFIWALENYKLKDKTIYLFFLIFGIVAVGYTHPISLIFLVLILVSYLFHFLINKDYNKLKRLCLFSILSLIFIIPILKYFCLLLIDLFFGNIGSSSPYGIIAQTMTQYSSPTFSTYLKSSGILVIFLSLFGLFSILNENFKKNLQIVSLVFLSIILSLGSWLHIYVPTDRMQAYLFIPLIILSSISIKYLMDKKNNYLKYLIISVVIIFAISNILLTSPWFALWHGEIDMGDYLNENYEANKLYYFDKGVKIEFLRFEHPGSITDNKDLSAYIITKNKENYINFKLIKQSKDYYLFKK